MRLICYKHSFVSSFQDYCPECRIAALEANLALCRETIVSADEKVIPALEAENKALLAAAKRAKVLLDDATYHDGRYGQHTDAAWQKEACEVAKLLEDKP